MSAAQPPPSVATWLTSGDGTAARWERRTVLDRIAPTRGAPPAHRRRPGGADHTVTALDGVRALAVIGVVASHAGVPGLGGGFVGVDVFFVLSGFLITSLLLSEHRRTGRVALGAFWARRARRLLPALVAMVLAVGAGRALFTPDSVAGLRTDALAALFWVANWRFEQAGTDYFAVGGNPSPLQHTWSLGVEEQFYLLWPLLVVGAAALLAWPASRRVRREQLRGSVGRIALGGAVVSAVLAVALAWVSGVNRVYFGSDTRAQGLLIGAALATVLLPRWPGADRHSATRPTGRVKVAAAGGSLVGLVGLCAAAHWATGGAENFRFGLLTGVAGSTALVVGGVMLDQQGAVARVLSVRPLVALGRISYGVYLWHWPTLLVLDGARTGLAGAPLLTVRLAAILALATASWWLVERPVRRLPALPRLVLPAAATAVTAAAVIVIVAVPVGLGAAASPALAAASGASRPALPAPPTAPGGSTSPAPSRSPGPTTSSRPGPHRPLRVDGFGDSIGWTLMRYLPATPGLSMINHAVLGCGVVQGGPYRYFGQVSQQPPGCDDWPTTWAGQVAADRPAAVLLVVGRWETMDRMYQGRWSHVGETAFDQHLSTELTRAIAVLGSTGAKIVVSNESYNRRGEQPDGSLYPEDQPARVNAWNALLGRVLSATPNTTLLDLNHKLCPDGVFTWTVDGIQVRSDGVHLTPAGVTWLTPWLTASLRADAGP